MSQFYDNRTLLRCPNQSQKSNNVIRPKSHASAFSEKVGQTDGPKFYKRPFITSQCSVLANVKKIYEYAKNTPKTNLGRTDR